MKFTLTWLNQFVSTENWTPVQIADQLTMRGLEVDSITPLHSELEQIITARVLDVAKHPDADKLTLCTVDGGKEKLRIVCGAPNVRAGMVTALACSGVQLPDGTKIKKSKVRGVVSEGMLCSARELGLSTDHAGIMELDENLACGISLLDALKLRDTVIEVDLTPNRADCASVRGIAREVSSFTNMPLQALVPLPAPMRGQVDFDVIIEARDLCPRYAARKLHGVRIGPSPLWMQQRLNAVGMRPINNIVDITNYVMLESGQPLHAFDFTTIKGQKIIVRRPMASETEIVTLDGNTRKLDADTLLICDSERPVALAGVMGGLETEITENTSTILLESACFDPVSVRKTARRLGIPSEASYRFERGVDPNLADLALQRAVDLMVTYAGATPDADGQDVYPDKKEALQLKLRVDRTSALLGVELDAEALARHLQGIECATQILNDNILQVAVPTFRMDIAREIDLVEEVARLIGYDAIPVTQPVIQMDYPERNHLRDLRQKVAEVMCAQGFFEAINYSFGTEKHFDWCELRNDDLRRKVTRLVNPISEEQNIMRAMLLPGLLDNIRHNLSFQQYDIRLFETGKVFRQIEAGQLPEETYQICGVLSGQRYPQAESLYFSSAKTDFFDLKGTVSNLLTALRRQGEGKISFALPNPEEIESYAEPVSTLVLKIGTHTIGTLAAVHPKVLKNFNIKQGVFFFEINLQQILGVEQITKKFIPLPKYPSVTRDISLVVPAAIPAGELLQTVYSFDQKHFESAEIFDIYTSKSLPSGYKSVALSVTYRSSSGTLDDRTVEKIHGKIVQALMANFNARYREGAES